MTNPTSCAPDRDLAVTSARPPTGEARAAGMAAQRVGRGHRYRGGAARPVRRSPLPLVSAALSPAAGSPSHLSAALCSGLRAQVLRLLARWDELRLSRRFEDADELKWRRSSSERDGLVSAGQQACGGLTRAAASRAPPRAAPALVGVCRAYHSRGRPAAPPPVPHPCPAPRRRLFVEWDVTLLTKGGRRQYRRRRRGDSIARPGVR